MEAARPATGDDVLRLARLARDAKAELASHRGGQVWTAREARAEPLEEAFSALVEDGSARVLVASIDGAVLGYAVARVEALRDGSRLGVVEDIYVDPGVRGIGLGAAMMEDLVGWCAGLGCFGMDAIALPGDRETKNFFEGSGFTARQLVMHHRLGRAGPPEGSGSAVP